MKRIRRRGEGVTVSVRIFHVCMLGRPLMELFFGIDLGTVVVAVKSAQMLENKHGNRVCIE